MAHIGGLRCGRSVGKDFWYRTEPGRRNLAQFLLVLISFWAALCGRPLFCIQGCPGETLHLFSNHTATSEGVSLVSATGLS